MKLARLETRKLEKNGEINAVCACKAAIFSQSRMRPFNSPPIHPPLVSLIFSKPVASRAFLSRAGEPTRYRRDYRFIFHPRLTHFSVASSRVTQRADGIP